MSYDGSHVSELRQSFRQDVEHINDLESLTELRVKYLGKKGLVSGLLSAIGSLPPDKRQSYGAVVNDLKNEFTSIIEDLRFTLEQATLERQLNSERIDVTLPSRGLGTGFIHPLSKVISDIRRILESLGFILAQGPEIEDDWHNFTALNIPYLHPARQMHDTFYTISGAAQQGKEHRSKALDGVKGSSSDSASGVGSTTSDSTCGGALHVGSHGGVSEKLLRTHTSNVQIRYMSKNEPPHRIYSIGKVYRSDYDATHTPMFHQAEGLLIDVDVTLGHLKWCLETFLCEFFEINDAPIRFRPSYFPFTEPSYEVDVRCDRSKKGEIKIGQGDDWLEILGCGMVHQNVLKNVDIDVDKFQGFAFGIGVERLAMLKYGISDLRSFFHGDVRWLEHYGFDII